MAIHGNAILSDRHATHNWEFANAAARAAKVDFVAGDVGKDALDLDTKKFFRVKSVSGGVATYTELGGIDINSLTSKTTPVDADTTIISDSADSNNSKKVSLTNLWANYFKGKADTLYGTIARSLPSG